MDRLNKQVLKQGKLEFARQGIFNVRDDLETSLMINQLPKAPRWQDHWKIWCYDADPDNQWNAVWCTMEYDVHSNGKIKKVVFNDSNLVYKPHCIRRIFERKGFCPQHLPKSIPDSEWLEYCEQTNIIGIDKATNCERRIVLPFMDGMIVVAGRRGIFGTEIKCHSKGIKSLSEPFGKRSYIAYSYVRDLNETQEATLYYINKGQFDLAVEYMHKWVKPRHDERYKFI